MQEKFTVRDNFEPRPLPGSIYSRSGKRCLPVNLLSAIACMRFNVSASAGIKLVAHWRRSGSDTPIEP